MQLSYNISGNPIIAFILKLISLAPFVGFIPWNIAISFLRRKWGYIIPGYWGGYINWL